jgi:hypothetical protein
VVQRYNKFVVSANGCSDFSDFFTFLYVLQHKTQMRYCAREKKIVPLQATYGVECALW